MDLSFEVKYAQLLLDYCLEFKEGSKLLIQSTTLAIPLIQELYKGGLQRGGLVEVLFHFENQENLQNQFANVNSAKWISPAYTYAVNEFDTYLYIRAPFIQNEYKPMDEELLRLRRNTFASVSKIYNERTASRSLRRSLCQFPVDSSALDANMSLMEYQNFIAEACFLNSPNPINEWKLLSIRQQKIVDFLNTVTSIRYVNKRTDIHFSVDGRTWINSDGRTNMPSGEVYTSPVEDSVNGHIFFDYPFIYKQQIIQGVSLEVSKGTVINGHATEGDILLQDILNTPGGNIFGEVAIGTNPNIQRPTKNILFDEKIAGTIHMALGQSYLQCGGKNESAVHQDMIADMKEGGQIYADEKLIYENGKFLEFD